MSSTPRKSVELFVEPLEARIAPTGLVAITNPDPNNPAGTDRNNYITYQAGTTPGGLHFQPGSDFGVAGADIYAIRLTGDGSLDPARNNASNGDRLVIYNSVTGFDDTNPFLQAANGSLVGFFRDANHDGHVQTNELVGISAGKSASINVNGTVNGPIVDNLKNGGFVKLDGVLKTKQIIANLNVTGSVTGDILAGGSVVSFTVAGDIHGILTGTAANGYVYSLGDPGVPSGTFQTSTPAANVPGPSIGSLAVTSSVGSIVGTLHTGDGGLHQPGGAINGLIVQNDTDGFALVTGNGGNGDSSAGAGQGGSVANLLVRGVIDTTNNRSLISIATGHGGDNDALKGGKGGGINGVAIGYDVGFDFNAGTGSSSVDHPNDSVLIHAGDGGTGLRGGKGGATNNIHVVTATADDGNNATAETQVLSGNGGASFNADTGLGGKGGSMDVVELRNLLVPTATVAPGSILVQAGNGGASKPGGSINTVTLLGEHLTVNAGDGADGFNFGGQGGSVSGVAIDNLVNLFATRVVINAGSGGAGFNGNGGNGGSLDTVTLLDSRLESLTINGGNHANGGTGTNGVGGVGGLVNNINVNDSSGSPITATNGLVPAVPAAPVTIRSGNGGDGTSGGRDGGVVTNTTVTGTNLAFVATSGSGGSVTGGGDGDAGNGGMIASLNLANQPVQVFNLTTTAIDPGTGLTITTTTVRTTIFSGNTATVASGNGGNAANGAGGVGGDVSQLEIVSGVNVTPQPDLNAKPAGFVPDNFTVTSGSGGSGAASAGKGGDLTSPLLLSVFGAVSMHAGDAGSGALGANGGSITGGVATALQTISMIGGNGGSGGLGGSITNSGTNLAPVTFTDAAGNLVVRETNNEGGLLVRAGNGSTGGVAGAGGAVTNFSGYVSSGGTTTIAGGAGGSGDGKITGAGGAVSNIKLTGVNDGIATGSTINIDAGDAGTAVKSKRGSAGGDVTQINLYNLDAGSVVHHVAAGDGSSGKKTGGNGGNVTSVHVGLATEQVDIGYRSGHLFGYNADQSGGIFAGAAGTGNQAAGTSGNVTDITAAAIASIVAGKSGDLGLARLANRVDGIVLVGPVSGVVTASGNSNGSFSNFAQANLVGSVFNPAATGASTFQANQDGLIAARTITQNRNFTAEAALTVDADGNLTLGDLQEPNRNLVIIPFG